MRICILAFLAASTALANQSEIAKFDPHMAQKNAVVTNGVKWIDGKYLPLEGRAFDDTEHYYDRLPANVTTNVNGGVRSMKHHTSGMLFRFVTDSKKLTFKWVPYNEGLSMDHMPSTGMSGIDVYRYDAAKGRWLYVATGRIWDGKNGGTLSVDWTPGTPCLVNLPLYNGVKSFSLGVDPAAKVEALGPRKSGVDKPVVFYGTSITHGGCCSRPGLAFVNRVGRDFDVPVVGLGFSGSGFMEYEMSEHLARIDASCYVLDCLWNMALTEKERPGRSVEGNYERFIRNLRAKRPDTPIIMAEACDVYGGCGRYSARLGSMKVAIRKLYEKLLAEGWKNLVYLPDDEMFVGDYEGTVDGCHPNDLGMESMARAFGKAVLLALSNVKSSLPRPDYPRPQFERAAWVNLNGLWTYTFDFGQSGLHKGRELYKSKGFEKTILVPFCPESELSGVGYKDFIPAMWYHRKLAIPAEWKGERIFLNFGGVDYESEIYIDGVTAGLHYGGSASFSVDLTQYVTPGKTHDLVIRVKDETIHGQPRGKQCDAYKSCGCSYTRTTGIWQTVWLEAVDPAGLMSCRIVPDLDGRAFVFTPAYLSERACKLRIAVKTADGKAAGAVEVKAVNGVAVVVPLAVVKTWSPEDPHLYDIVYETVDADGKVRDTVKAYSGLRKVSVENGRVCLNGKPRYLRFVLDQGFYPDGIWTAPSDAALKRDIELSMAAGFNGARLHQKVFEERFHYWADRLGYLTWGEMSSWGSDPTDIIAARNFIPEWCEVVRRDLNHPSIIAWTPYNETWNLSDPNQHQRAQNDVYELTKAIDPTRPVNGSSGDFHAKTDLWTIHCYDRAPKLGAIDRPEGEVFCPDWLKKGKNLDRLPYWRYDGQPYLIDEFGGLGWIPPERRAADNTWGYGNAIKTEEEFFSILKAEVDQILGVKRICGYCYTQLTDVEQEQNGVYYYDRTPKFDVKKFKDIFGRDR